VEVRAQAVASHSTGHTTPGSPGPKQRGRLNGKAYTVIIVPHAKARFRKFRVPVRFARVVGSLLAVGTLLVIGVVGSFSTVTAELYSLRAVRSQNEALQEKTQSFQQDAVRLRTQLASLQRTVDKLGVMAGLETSLPEAALGGRGGTTGLESRSPSLDAVIGMERTATELAQRSARLEEYYRDQKVLLASTPSIWPVRGYLSSYFGNRNDPFTGQKDFHPGIDISTPIGTKIVAPADGVVVSAKRRGAYGNAIIINHGYGIMTRYGHLSGFNVKPGRRVRRGDVIGFVGNTGRSNAPHLHYEVWVRNQTKNPIHFILDEYRSFG